jgi:YggT family protein
LVHASAIAGRGFLFERSVLEDAEVGAGVQPVSNPFFTYWWFHLPNLVMATLMYTAIGRFVLTFVFDPGSPNYIWRFFVRITDPVLKLVGFVTPRAVPPLVVLLFSVVWLFAARAALLLLVTMTGVAPTTGATG